MCGEDVDVGVDAHVNVDVGLSLVMCVGGCECV